MAGGTALLMAVSCCSVKPRARFCRDASMVSSGDPALVGVRILLEGGEGRRHLARNVCKETPPPHRLCLFRSDCACVPCAQVALSQGPQHSSTTRGTQP